jgi:hypothetical protein
LRQSKLRHSGLGPTCRDRSSRSTSRRSAQARTLFVSGYTNETLQDRVNLPLGSVFLEQSFQAHALLRELRAMLDGHGPPRGAEPRAAGRRGAGLRGG